MAELKEPIIEPTINTVTEIRRKEKGKLIIEQTHETPVTKVTEYNIASLTAQVTKINNVIAKWEEKKAPMQAIIDEYTELK